MKDDSGGSPPAIARADERARDLAECEDIASAVGEGLCRLDLDGRFVAVTGFVAERTGRDGEELLGQPVATLLDDADADRFAAAVEDLRSGAIEGPRTVTVTVRDPDGEPVPVEFRMGVREIDREADAPAIEAEDGDREADGRTREIAAVVRDAADEPSSETLRRREVELRREKAFSESLLDAQRDVVYAFDESGRFLRWNDRLTEVTGYDDEEVADMHPLDFFDGEATERVAEAISDVVEDGETVIVEAPVVTADGERIPYEFSGAPLTDEDGRIEGLTGVGRDVSRHWEIEEQLREERDQFESLVREVEDYAIFRLDPDGTVASWNEGAERIKGYEEGEIVGEHFSRFYTEDAREEGVPERNLEAAAEDGRVEDEGWRVREDGSRFWANVVITALYDDGGGLDGYAKVTRDMTERHEYEEQLRRERDLVEQIIETSPVGLMMLTPDGEIVRANDRVTSVLDLPGDETRGQNVTEWPVYDEDGKRVPTEDWPFARAVETGEPVTDWHCQIERPDGERRWLSVSAAPVGGDSADVDRLVVAAEDITDIKEREAELRRERDLNAQMMKTVPIPVSVQSADGETMMANQRAQELLDMTEEEFIEGPREPEAWRLYDASGEPIDDDETPAARAMATGEPVLNEELVIERPDGERIWLSVNAAPVFGPDGDIERVVTAGEDISQLKAQADRLERQRDDLQSELNDVFSRVSEAFFAVDGDWRFTYVNDRAETLLEREATELIGESLWEAFSATVGTTFQEKYEEAMERQETVTFEEYYPPLDAWFEVRAYPSESGLSVYFRDVTERKERERELEESERRYRTLAENFPNGAVGLFDDDLRYTLIRGQIFDEIGYSHEGLEGSLVREAFPPSIYETIEPRYRAALNGESSTFEVDVDGRHLRIWTGPVTDDDGEVISGLAMSQDITEQRERQRELERSEQRYRTLAENFPNGSVVMFDTDLRYTLIEGEFAADLGVDGDAWVGEKISDVHPPEAEDAFREHYRAAIEGEATTFETEYGDRTLQVRAAPIRDENGEVFAGMAMSQDVTERKQRERELERTERRFRAIFEDPNILVGLLDPDGTVLDINRTAMEYIDTDLDEVRDELFWETPWWGSDESVQSDVREWVERAAAGEYVNFEVDLVRPDGEEYTINGVFRPVTNDEGEVVSIVVSDRDVTERKQRERELERYETIVETVDDGIYTVDRDGRFTMVNEAYASMLGYEPDELLGERVSLVVDEGTREEAAEIERRLKAGEAGDESLEAVLTRSDGDEITAESVFAMLPNGSERVGVVRDITERKRRERELEQYRALTQAANDVILTIDETSTIRSVNPAVEDVFGYAADELEGEPITTLMSDDIADAHLAAVTEYLRTGERHLDWDYIEVPGRHRDGHDVPLSISFSETTYGDERFFTGVIRDVTDRKERERELERYRTIVETVDDGVYALDPDENFAMVNEAFLEMTGYERDELLGAPATAVHSAEVSAEASAITEAAARGESDNASIEFDLLTADGDEIPAEVRLGPYPYDGERYGRCGVVRDITDRKEYEETLRALHDSALELIQTESAAEVDAVVAESVTDVLDLSGVIVYRYDAERELLLPTASSTEAEFMRDEFPAVPPGDGSITGHVYASGETTRYGDITDSPKLHTENTGMRGGVFVPLGEHGVLVVGSTEPDAFDDRTQQLIELVGATAEAAYDRVDRETRLRERENQLATRVQQQRVVAELGRRALETDDLDSLMAEASELVAEALGNEYCKVLDLDPERRELLLRQGVGWDDGIVGSATVAADEDDSQAAYTLRSEEPVIVENLATETRFSGPELLTGHDVKSGISVIIGSTDDPWGILGTHDTERREFTATDANFVQNVANVLASAIDRRERERELEQRGEQLEALNDLNAVVRDIIRAVVSQSTREEIERLVCRRLADTDSYQFSWIGDVGGTQNRVNLRAEAGAEDYLDGVDITYDDSEASRGPTGRAIKTKQMQVSRNLREDADYETWKDRAEEFGFQSSAAIPILYEGSLYGVLNVYSERPDAFDGQEGTVIGQLGEIVGHAIAAIERKEALMSDDVIEIEFEIQNIFEALDIPGSGEGTITLDRTIPAGGNDYLVYGTADEAGMETLENIVASVSQWESVDVIGERGDLTRFEARLSEPPIVTLVASQGGRVRQAQIEDGDYHMIVHLPHGADVRRIVDEVQGDYADAEVIAQRQTTAKRSDSSERTSTAALDELTERQRAALEAAFYAGFFEWPRESTGEDVAESLDISAATFHQHMRAGERKILTALFGETA